MVPQFHLPLPSVSNRTCAGPTASPNPKPQPLNLTDCNKSHNFRNSSRGENAFDV